MALEAVVFQQDLFGQNSNSKELYNYNLLNGNWSSDHFVQQQQEDDDFKGGGSSLDYFLEDQTEIFHQGGDWTSSSPSMLPHHHFNDLHQMNPSPDSYNIGNGVTSTCADHQHLQPMEVAPTILPDSNGGNRARRRRSRSRKNKEEIENQRMTHIAVERNRRKQMNEYLSVLRSLMPESYVQRGDQASIIGGAINFVKELEQRLQSLGGHTDIKEIPDGDDVVPSPPFSEFFTFPQYSTSSSTARSENQPDGMSETMSGSGTQSSGVADIEVTIVESHANLKIRSKRRPKQLLKLVSGLHTMRLNILHLNVTTADQIVLYSISVKVEDDCKLSSVDEIATALHQLLGRIQEESMMN